DRLREFAGACLHLVEQPHVLDRDHRLVGKGLDQLDLLVGKGLEFGLQHHDNPAKSPFAEHRNRQYGAVILLFDQFGKLIVGLLKYVADMNCTSLKGSSSRYRASS